MKKAPKFSQRQLDDDFEKFLKEVHHQCNQIQFQIKILLINIRCISIFCTAVHYDKVQSWKFIAKCEKKNRVHCTEIVPTNMALVYTS